MHTIRNISRIYDSFGNDSGKGGGGWGGGTFIKSISHKKQPNVSSLIQ